MAELPSSSSSSQQALQKLNEQLICPMGLEPYMNTKLLQCFHVFCENCLKPLAYQTPQGQVVDCPNCRQPTSLPQNGVPGLQGDFLIHHLFDIYLHYVINMKHYVINILAEHNFLSYVVNTSQVQKDERSSQNHL